MRNLKIEEEISAMNELAMQQCREATTMEQVLGLDSYYFGEKGVLYKMVDSYLGFIEDKIAGHTRFWSDVELIMENCVKDCHAAVTLNDLMLVKAKYLGKNGIITLMQKEQGNSYKESKQKEMK